MTLRLMASISRRKAFAGAAATTALLAAPAIVRGAGQRHEIGAVQSCHAQAIWRRPAKVPIAAP